MSGHAIASGLGVLGSALQLVGSVMNESRLQSVHQDRAPARTGARRCSLALPEVWLILPGLLAVCPQLRRQSPKAMRVSFLLEAALLFRVDGERQAVGQVEEARPRLLPPPELRPDELAQEVRRARAARPRAAGGSWREARALVGGWFGRRRD